MNESPLPPTAPSTNQSQKWRWWRVLVPAVITYVAVAMIVAGILFFSALSFRGSQMCSEMAILVCGAFASVLALVVGAGAYFGIGIPLFYRWRIGNFGGVAVLGFFSAICIGWIISLRTSLQPIATFPLALGIELGMYVFWDWVLNVFAVRRWVKALGIAMIFAALLFGASYNNGASGIYVAAQSSALETALQKTPMTLYAPPAGYTAQPLDIYPLDSSSDQFDKGAQIALTDNLNLMESPAPTGDPIADCSRYVDVATSCQIVTTLGSGDKVYTADDGTYFIVKGHTLVTTGGGVPYMLTAQDIYDILGALRPTTAQSLVNSLPKH